MDNEIILEAALKEINSIRDALGLEAMPEMLKGIVCSRSNCPVARTFAFGLQEAFPELQVSVGTSRYGLSIYCGPQLAIEVDYFLNKRGISHSVSVSNEVYIPLVMEGAESYLSRFIRLFDNQEYPEFIGE